MTAIRISLDSDRTWVDGIHCAVEPVGYGPTTLLMRYSDLPGSMTHLVANLTLDSASSCVMQGASCTQRKISMVLFVLPSILLSVVIVVTVVIVVVIPVVVVVAIVGVVFVIVVPLVPVFLLVLSVFAKLAACASKAAATLSTTSCRMACFLFLLQEVLLVQYSYWDCWHLPWPAACASRALLVKSAISCRRASKVMAGVSDVEVLLGWEDFYHHRYTHNVVEEEDGEQIRFLGGNSSSGIKKYRGLNSSDGGNIRDRVKIAGGVIGSGDEIGSNTPNTRIHKDHPIDNVIGEVQLTVQTRRMTKPTSEQGFLSDVNKARLVVQGHRQEEGIDYEEVFALVAKNLRQIRLFLAYASFMGFLVYVDDIIFGSTNKELLQQKEDGIFISQDKYVAEILKKFNYSDVKSASTPVDLEKPLVKDGDADDVDVHLYRSMIGSLMYLTASRPDIMFAVCACARFQVTPKTSHLLAVKRIFRYLKGKPTLGLWYSRDSPFELVAYTDSDYARATQDRKSTTGGCQFLGNRLISWQCKKQTVVATSTTEAEYVAAASCCGQNQKHLGMSKEVGTPRYLSLVVPLKKVGDEAVHKELGDRMERAATTASSLEAEQDSGSGPRCQDTILGDVNAQTRFEIASKQSNDPPLSRESDGFAEIIDFLKASSVHYALTVNLIIYTSCIEQFWTTAKVQKGNGVRQLQALVDKKRVIVTESSIRRDFHLDDAEGTDWLPTTTIFEELAHMGYEKPSQKLTFYKAFFSPQWKYFIHTITQCLSAKSTAWNEFSCSMGSLIICLATNQKFNLSKFIFDAMVKHLDVGVKFLMYPHFIQVFITQQLRDMSTHKKIFVNPFHTKKVFANMKISGKDYSWRITPLFATMMVQASEEVGEDLDHPTNSTQEEEVSQDEIEHEESVPTPSNDPQPSEKAKDAQAKEIAALKKRIHKIERKKMSRPTGLKRLKKVGMSRRVNSSEDQESLVAPEDASKQGRSIADIDADVKVTLVDETQERQDDNLMFDTRVLDTDEMPVEEKVDEKDEHSTKLDDSTASEAVITANVEDSAAPTTIEEITLAQTLIQI
ncbi:uncharacterized mitochondrial protein-like protein [Tanacetum coccineum]